MSNDAFTALLTRIRAEVIDCMSAEVNGAASAPGSAPRVAVASRLQHLSREADSCETARAVVREYAALCEAVLDAGEKLAEANARREREKRRLEAILEALPVGLVMADAAGELSRVNRADDRLWGDAEESPSSSGRDLRAITGERKETERRAFARSLSAGEVVENQHLDIVSADGKAKTIRASTAPLRDDSGAIVGAVAVNVDVTEEVRALAEARAAARAREEIVGMVSHDLKDPLGVIAGSALAIERVLSHGGKDETVAKGKVQVIRRAVQRMEQLITDLLDLARIDASKLPIEVREESAKELLEQAMEVALPMAQAKGIDLRVEGLEGRVSCDRERVLQVFANLVGNALKLTPERGKVLLAGTREGREWTFSVRDTGPGIPREQLPFVFDRFWKGSGASRHGVGLGLAIAKGIVEAHGGAIRAESPDGGGAMFTFTLPTA